MRLTPRSNRSSHSSTHSLLTAATAAALLSSSALVSAANITLSIGTAHSAVPSLLGASTHATLHSAGPALSAPLRRDNSFAFADVAPGSYLLSVHSRDYAFENLRVDVGVEKKQGEVGQEEVVRAWQTFRGNEWDNRGEKRGEGRGGRANLEVRVMGGKEYYIQRGGFSPLSFLKNPMILMGLFSLGLIVGMPYIYTAPADSPRLRSGRRNPRRIRRNAKEEPPRLRRQSRRPAAKLRPGLLPGRQDE
ncbi:hypothetical protein JOL62DRAFT_578682 [Phyllosticta paracitricarpa]|uniref:ER membrane protein complex subunit 7 beta-sandwich domain-containing protein n=1 Tax=Phyllosticta paracitricarpa TaxID=2016321 RepID=A0ABR1N2L6_9PEZI